ncbi:pancreatic triacylglycerol lipase-like [Macrobrachium rosenbergii]|uniref:pancreatic triacylglycerol lipase-like n=2 Tax=cellular organisms TaxID=131567 RepID=UPI0034D514BB
MRLLICSVVLLALGARSLVAVPLWKLSKGFENGDNCVVVNKSASGCDTRLWHDDVLGDLIIDESWYVGERVFNFCPYSRSYINTQFILHTQQDPGEVTDTFLVADKSIIDSTTFDPTKPTKFITHGFIDTGNCQWLKDMVRAMLRYGDFNVIRVNWGDGSLPLYGQAAANTRVVGLEIAHLVNFLVENYGVDPASVHLLGHSLGSHISGYAGDKIPNLGRITGMDPAGPYYEGTPEFIRLDDKDATFVDAVHTDAKTILLLGYGTEEAMGNIDFYPNAGFNQPGCDPVTIGIQFIIDIGEGVRELAACSHQRSVQLITDSFDQPCPYVAHECIDYDTFDVGRCPDCGDDNSKCAVMGVHAIDYPYKERVNVKMYFDTDKQAPFCYYHYQIVIDTAHPRGAPDTVQGNLDIWMYGDNGESIEKFRLTDRKEHFENGQPKYFLLKSHKDLSRVIRMEVNWEYVALLTDEEEEEDTQVDDLFNHKLYIRTIHVSPLDHTTEAERLDYTDNLCEFGKEYTELSSGDTKSFASDESCVFTP